jgi:type I restriction enzyme S subunit
MNAERLLALYERVAEAPDAITRLRRFILDLAVRGKLVPQDPNDEPASELLKRIAQEKARLVKAGEIRRREALPELIEDDCPFPIPSAWAWCRLGSLGWTQTGTTPSKANPDFYGDRIPFIKPGDLHTSYVDYENEGLSKKGLEEVGRIAPPGSILMVCIGTIGKCQLINRNCSFNQQINALSPFSVIASRYLLAACQSDLFQKAAWAASARTTIAILNKQKWEMLSLPLPPLAEQHRIVAKVDELMALCDQLEAARQEREARRDRLAAASLARLNTPDPETFQSDARFTLNALPALTTRPNQIKQLRQTILNLAVRGKLVPQDPQDEPASELLKRIAQTKRQLVASKMLRKLKELEPLSEYEIKFTLPGGWVAARLGTVYDVRDGTHDTPKYADDGYPLITSKNLSSGRLSFADIKFISEQDHRQISERSAVQKDDILLAMIGSIGNPVVVDTDRPFSIKNVALLKYYDRGLSSPGYLCVFLQHAAEEMRQRAAGGLQPFVSLGFLRSYPFALPPLAEQHRIVAKVDELMALCDRLEASLTTSNQTRTRLLEATLTETLALAGDFSNESIQATGKVFRA